MLSTVCALLGLQCILAAQLRVDVRLVNLVATVTDANGRYVANLTEDDFRLAEDGIEQEIRHFSQDKDIPVSVGIVMDTSGSMERKIRTATDAVDRFIRSIHPDDEIFFMTFNARPTLRQDFTDDRNALSRALRSVRVGGGTALYDAVAEGVGKARDGQHDKRAVLLISDGEDTSSEIALNDAMAAVRESELLVYPIGISPSGPTSLGTGSQIPLPFPLPPIIFGPGGQRGGGSSRGPGARTSRDTVDYDVLESLAEASGGRAFLLSDSWFTARNGQVDKVLDQIADELRSQYTLGYYPAHGDDGKWHTVKLTVRKGLHVRYRKGYLAAER